MGRQKKTPLEQMSGERQNIFQKIAKGRKNVSDGHIGGPFDSWILNPELGRRIVSLGNYFRFGYRSFAVYSCTSYRLGGVRS